MQAVDSCPNIESAEQEEAVPSTEQDKQTKSEEDMRKAVSSAYITDIFNKLEVESAADKPKPQNEESPRKKSKKKKSKAADHDKNESADANKSLVLEVKETSDELEVSLSPEKQKSVVVTPGESLQKLSAKAPKNQSLVV